ncbi:MAG: TorF family putative porin [Massilia sp.]
MALCAVLVALAAPAAHAQASASASIASEYSQRGVSLSRGRPVAQLRVDYDAPNGWYAGAFASRAELAEGGVTAQVIAYGGYARRLPSGLTWEAGVLNASFMNSGEYRYHEFYAGLAHDRVSGRLYFSPAYYGGPKTMYAELNSTLPLRERLTLIGHVGLLHGLDDRRGEARNHLDLRLGLGLELGDCNVQLAVLARTPGGRERNARALALSASYAF